MLALRVTAAAALLACTFAAAAEAKLTPAWSYVPAQLRAKLAAESGGSLFLPARTPLFYRYRSGAIVRGGALEVTFTNRVRVHKGLWRWTKQTFAWRVSALPSGVACVDWGGTQKTLQLAGNNVYWSAAPDGGGGTAWRCVKDRGGRMRVLAASNSGRLPDVALGIVAASGLDVSGRT